VTATVTVEAAGQALAANHFPDARKAAGVPSSSTKRMS
jgi:hypothetical protein